MSNSVKSEEERLYDPAIETAKTLVTQPWGAVETGANLFSQTYGLPAMGLAGVAGLPFGKSREWSEAVGKGLIYQPQTEAGRKITEATFMPFELLGRASEKGADIAREAKGGRPSSSEFPWMAEAMPFGEREPTEEERAMAGTVAGTAIMSLPLLLGLRRHGAPTQYPKVPSDVITRMRTGEGTVPSPKPTAISPIPQLPAVPRPATEPVPTPLPIGLRPPIPEVSPYMREAPVSPEVKIRRAELFGLKKGIIPELESARKALEPIKEMRKIIDSDLIGVPEINLKKGYSFHQVRKYLSTVSLDDFGKIEIPGFRLIEKKPDYAKEHIAWLESNGDIALSVDFFEHSAKDRMDILSHEFAHKVESIIPAEEKVKLFDNKKLMSYRGRNINEKLANWIQGGNALWDIGIPEQYRYLAMPDVDVPLNIEKFIKSHTFAVRGKLPKEMRRVESGVARIPYEEWSKNPELVSEAKLAAEKAKVTPDNLEYVGLQKFTPYSNDAMHLWNVTDPSSPKYQSTVAGPTFQLTEGQTKRLRPMGVLKGQRGSLGETKPVPMWYSTLQRTIEDKMPNSAPVEQVRALLNTPGVKVDEVKWTGLDDFLASKTGKVSKNDVMQHLRENEVKVEEVVKGGPSGFKTHMGPLTTDIKFFQWQLPGGENYRELLLTLPQKESIRLREVQTRLDEISAKPAQWHKEHPEILKEWDALMIEGNKLIAERPPTFKGTHFDEPNVLAHVRFNDRVDAQGKKVLFIEEVQSDWHQAGREKGYKGEWEKINKEFEDFLKQKGVKVSEKPEERITGAMLEKAGAHPEMISRWYEHLKSIKGIPVPAAPFAKTWHELMMRRMVRWASENGYDKVAWTTGEQQAARYDLSKHINSIDYEYNGSTKTGRLIAFGKANEPVIEQGGVRPEEIERYVGKEPAQKLLNQIKEPDIPFKFARIEGVDLKVGGEGMKGFYDKIIPEYMNKFGKKWGAKVGETQFEQPFTGELRGLPGESAIDALKRQRNEKNMVKVHSLDITSSMKKSVLEEGLPLFQLLPPVAVGVGLLTERLTREKRKSQPSKQNVIRSQK